MGSLGVGLKRVFVLVNFVEPYPVLVVGVLNHVEPQAAWFVIDRSTGILKHPFDVLVLETFLDLDRGNYDVHGASRIG